jgi:hypothetical protein
MKYAWNTLHKLPPQTLVEGVPTSEIMLTVSFKDARGNTPKLPIISLCRLEDKTWMDTSYPFAPVMIDLWTKPVVGSRDVKKWGDEVYLVQFPSGQYALTWYREPETLGCGTVNSPYHWSGERWIDTESMGDYPEDPVGYSLVEIPDKHGNYAQQSRK